MRDWMLDFIYDLSFYYRKKWAMMEATKDWYISRILEAYKDNQNRGGEVIKKKRISYL